MAGWIGRVGLLDVVADAFVEVFAEFVESEAAICGDGQDFDAFEAIFDEGDVVGRFWQVHFVGQDAPGAFGELVGVEGNLFAQGFEIGDRVAALAAGGIDDEHEEAAAHDVAEELVTEADIGVGTLDQARDIGNGGAADGVELHDTDHGLQGGEGVVSDFGAGSAEFGEERGFARVGEADETSVSDGAEFEIEVALLAGGAGGKLAWSLVGGGFEVDVTFAAFAALAEDELFTNGGEVGHGFEGDFNLAGFRVFFTFDPSADEGAWRDFVDGVFAGFTEALVALAVVAIFG